MSTVKQQDGTKPAFWSCHTKGIDDVLSESERHALGCFQRFPLRRVCQGLSFYTLKKTYLLEEAIEVNVYDIPSVRIHKDVFKMAIAETIIGVNGPCPKKSNNCRTQG